MRKKQDGVALIEFALALPLLLLLTVLTTEFGRALYEYNTLVKAVRDASRYLSVQDPSILTTDPGKVTVAKRLAVYGNPAGSGSPLAPGLDITNVPNPTWATVGSSPSINTVTIRITGYKFKPLISNLFGFAIGNAAGEIPYTDISATMRAQS